VDVQQGFPNLDQVFTDPKTGRIQQAWLQFLIALWNRTGAAPGTNTVVIVDDITVLTALVEELTALSLRSASPAGVAQLADAVEALTVQGLQRPAIARPDDTALLSLLRPAIQQARCCEDLSSLTGLARSIFAAALMVPRLISLTGDATGSAYFDGSKDIEIDVTVSGGGVSYVPLSMGTEPLTFVSDGLGQPILVPYTP
jgi:hypothetical protein